MIRRYRRASALLALGVFLFAALSRVAPTFCCSGESGAVQTESACGGCSQGSPRPEKAPAEQSPCGGGLGACPELCCSIRAGDQEMVVSARLAQERVCAAPPAILPQAWLGLVPGPVVLIDGAARPLCLSDPPFYLQFQSILC